MRSRKSSTPEGSVLSSPAWTPGHPARKLD
jgi:hypothetical protein